MIKENPEQILAPYGWCTPPCHKRADQNKQKMTNPLFQTLSQSAADFQHIVWPIASSFPLVGGGTLKPVEATATADFKDDLDLLAGIDAWQVDRGVPMMRGLASRVQWCGRYDTFSIRYRVPSGQPTEFAKRLTSIRNKDQGHLFPHLTVQAYLEQPGGHLLSCAVVETAALYDVAQEMDNKGIFQNSFYPEKFGIKTLPNGTEFIYLHWDFLLYHGILKSENVRG